MDVERQVLYKIVLFRFQVLNFGCLVVIFKGNELLLKKDIRLNLKKVIVNININYNKVSSKVNCFCKGFFMFVVWFFFFINFKIKMYIYINKFYFIKMFL